MAGQQQQRDNSGALFRNDRREKDTHPTHQGSCTIDGKQYWISGWVKESQKDGSRYFSLAFKPKMAQEHAGGSRNPPARTTDQSSDDGDIPF